MSAGRYWKKWPGDLDHGKLSAKKSGVIADRIWALKKLPRRQATHQADTEGEETMNAPNIVTTMMPLESMDDWEPTDDELRDVFSKMTADQRRAWMAEFYRLSGGLN